MKKPGTIAVLVLLLLAQACTHADRSMVRVRGGTFAMGIESAKIPGLERRPSGSPTNGCSQTRCPGIW